MVKYYTFFVAFGWIQDKMILKIVAVLCFQLGLYFTAASSIVELLMMMIKCDSHVKSGNVKCFPGKDFSTSFQLFIRRLNSQLFKDLPQRHFNF